MLETDSTKTMSPAALSLLCAGARSVTVEIDRYVVARGAEGYIYGTLNRHTPTGHFFVIETSGDDHLDRASIVECRDETEARAHFALQRHATQAEYAA